MRQTAPEGRGPPSYFSRICLLHIKSRTFLRGDKHITHTLAHSLMRRLQPLRAAALPAISPAYAYYTLNREPFCAAINTQHSPSRTLSSGRRPLRAAALPAISPAYAYYTLNREPFCAGINTSLTPSRTLSCDRRVYQNSGAPSGYI